MKTESRLPKAISPVPTDNGVLDPPVFYSLTFSKADADTLAALCDVALKAAGLPAAQAVNLWMDKVKDAMLATKGPL